MAHGSCCTGPGYASPKEALEKGPREQILYVVALIPDQQSREDYIAVVDVDPESSSYSTVISRAHVGAVGDELHHFGWNACSSCHGDPTRSRSALIVPGFKSSNVYVLDVATDPRQPKLKHVIPGSEIASKTGLAHLHSSHCLGNGDIVISALGTPTGEAKGGFVVLDKDFKVKGKWDTEDLPYGYDYWYQPRHNIIVTSEFGEPNSFFQGFDPSVAATKYGQSLHFLEWESKKLIKSVNLGLETGMIPLEVRFAHDPDKAYGFVGVALSSCVHLIYKDEATGEWSTKPVIRQEWTSVEGWVLPGVPPLVTDILISLDDKYLFFSNWLRGDLVQYDITDPHNPRLVSRLWLGGLIRSDGPLKVAGGLPEDTAAAPEIPTVRGKKLRGGPQMLQLSLDGKRLYVTNSLLSSWDKQFYPEQLFKEGSHLLQVDVLPDGGGLRLNPDFMVDFGDEPGGPVLAHEARYPGGDCSSDIWV